MDDQSKAIESRGRVGDFCALLVAIATLAIVSFSARAEAAPSAEPGVQLVDAWPGVSFDNVVHVTYAPGDAFKSFVYIVENGGRILRMQVPRKNQPPGKPVVWLDRSAKTQADGQGGLLSLAFHPDFARNGRAFISYAGKGARSNGLFVAEVKATGERANPEERGIFWVPKLSLLHNAGTIAFDKSGKLLVAVGDGATKYGPDELPQNRLSYLGKIHRLDVDVQGRQRYAIPKDNPFASAKFMELAKPEILAYGFRNPWKISVDSLGRIWTAEPGMDSREWVHVVQPGAFHGWPFWEGTRRNRPGGPKRVGPVFEYERGNREGSSAVGGVLYEGKAVPGLRGRYIFGDHSLGEVYSIDVTQDALPRASNHRLLGTCRGVAGLGRDAQGEVYAYAIASGKKRAILTLRSR